MFKLTSLTSQFNFYINTSGDASICTADLGIVFGRPHGERVALTYPGSRAEPLVRWSGFLPLMLNAFLHYHNLRSRPN